MATPDSIILKAREYIGIPWVHQGRSREQGVDCIGLIVCVAYELDLLPRRNYPTNYSRYPDGKWFQSLLERYMIPIRKRKDARMGDVLLFKTAIHPGHVGLLTKQGDRWGVIHAYVNGPGAVTEHLLTDQWWEKVVGIYRFPQGIEHNG